MDVLHYCQSMVPEPSGSSFTDPSMVSQLAIKIMEKPKMETKRKFRCQHQSQIARRGNNNAHS